MRNIWLIARHEYRRVVLRRGFLLGTLAVPLGLALLFGLAIAVEVMGEEDAPVGYVDGPGLLAEVSSPGDGAGPVTFLPFADEAAARAALEAGTIQAFYVLPPAYPAQPDVALFYNAAPPAEWAQEAFVDFLRRGLLAERPPATAARILAGPAIEVIDTSSGRHFDESAVINIVLPFVASLFFVVATMSAANYMMQVVTDEKENRTMEIIVTATAPGQLIAGKVAGLLAATLTQLLIYVVALAGGLIIARPYVSELQGLVVPWSYLGLLLLFFLPAYALIAAVMVAIGSAVTEQQEGQQVGGILNLLFVAPLFVTPLLFSDPGHPVLVGMTLFPTTSFLTVALRWGLGAIPLWQMVAGWLILVASTLGMVWVAARLFRIGMLRYGQPLSLKGAWRALRQAV